jgi:hypothetical protein
MIAGGEVKAPSLCNFYTMIENKELPDQYKLQVHFSMAVCEVDTWYWGGYTRQHGVFPLTIKRDSFTDQVSESLHAFKDVYGKRYMKVLNAIERLENNPSLETVL